MRSYYSSPAPANPDGTRDEVFGPDNWGINAPDWATPTAGSYNNLLDEGDDYVD
jgi:hypothetical protein